MRRRLRFQSEASAGAARAAGGSAATCCCTIPNSQNKLLAPDACTKGGGTCEATEDSCHGIEGPIP